MSPTRTFHIGDILSAMTGRLVSPTHVDGLYAILDHLTGDQLMTHQLPRAADEAEDTLRRRYPDLATITIPDWSHVPDEGKEAAVRGWLAEMVAEHGETREVAPLDPVDHTRIDPLTELAMMRPDAEVITVRLDAED